MSGGIGCCLSREMPASAASPQPARPVDEDAAMDPARAALLLLDLQYGYLGLLPEPDRLLHAGDRAAMAARSVGMTVVYPCISFRTGQPEVSRRNTMFGNPGARG